VEEREERDKEGPDRRRRWVAGMWVAVVGQAGYYSKLSDRRYHAFLHKQRWGLEPAGESQFAGCLVLLVKLCAD